MLRRMFGAVAGLAVACLAVCSLASPHRPWPGLGQPTAGQLGLQLPATDLMSEIDLAPRYVNVIIIVDRRFSFCF